MCWINSPPMIPPKGGMGSLGAASIAGLVGMCWINSPPMIPPKGGMRSLGAASIAGLVGMCWINSPPMIPPKGGMGFWRSGVNCGVGGSLCINRPPLGGDYRGAGHRLNETKSNVSVPAITCPGARHKRVFELVADCGGPSPVARLREPYLTFTRSICTAKPGLIMIS